MSGKAQARAPDLPTNWQQRAGRLCYSLPAHDSIETKKHRMIPWLQIDTAPVPGSDVELRLMRRGTEFSMMLDQNELMNSRLSGSEEVLATLACKTIEAVKRPHLLIGGLGMGFTPVSYTHLTLPTIYSV